MVHPMMDRSDDPSHHERSYFSFQPVLHDWCTTELHLGSTKSEQESSSTDRVFVYHGSTDRVFVYHGSTDSVCISRFY